MQAVLITADFDASATNNSALSISSVIKVSEYPFKQNENMLKNMTVLLYSYFYNIFLNVLRPIFFNIYIIYLFDALQMSLELGSKLGQKLTTFFTF